MARSGALLFLLPVLATGCYAELWGGAYPLSKASTQWKAGPAVERHDMTFSIGVSVGVWLDHYGIGLGAASAPISKEAVVGTIGAPTRAGATMAADHVRLDVDLPVRFGRPRWFTRGTLVVDSVESAHVYATDTVGSDGPAKGLNLFLGGTMAFFTRNVAGSAGVSYLHLTQEASNRSAVDYPALDYTALGAQVRLLVTFSLGLEAFRYYTPSIINPGPQAPGYKEQDRNHITNPGGCRLNPACY